MFRLARVAIAASLTLAAACSTPMTMPEMVADPAMTLEAAHARWVAIRPLDYSFEFEAQTATAPSPGFYRVTVAGGRLMGVQRSFTGEIAPNEQGFTIDQLWDRLLAARTAGDALSDLQFSRQEGIPMQAAVGSLSTDRGVRYRLRRYTVGIPYFF